MIDIHCHILPGLDDGARTMDDAVAMARIAVADGITSMVAAPHYWLDRYTPTPQQVRRAVGDVQDRLAAEGIPLKLLPAHEVMIAVEVPELLRRGELVTLGDLGEHLVMELPSLLLPLFTEKVVHEVISTGVRVILAHPEKNAAIQSHPEVLQRLVQAGCLVQMDADSLTGAKWSPASRCAARLLLGGLVHLLASDGHSPTDRPPILSLCAQRAAEILSPEVVRTMTTERPGQLVRPTKVTIRAALPA